jgi:hypothetical protein
MGLVGHSFRDFDYIKRDAILPLWQARNSACKTVIAAGEQSKNSINPPL